MSGVDSGEIDALITNFETLSNTTEEPCLTDEEEAVRTLVTWKESRQNLNVVKRDRNFSQNSNSQTPAPDIEQIRRRTRCFRCRRIGHFSKDCPERLQKKPVSQAKVLGTKEDLFASRKTKTLDELLLEIEQLSQERAQPVSDEPDEEEETCLLLHEPGKAIIDTGCGRGRYWSTDAQRDQGPKHWCHWFSLCGWWSNMQIKMHVVPREVPCLLKKGWLKENGAVLNTSSERPHTRGCTGIDCDLHDLAQQFHGKCLKLFPRCCDFVSSERLESIAFSPRAWWILLPLISCTFSSSCSERFSFFHSKPLSLHPSTHSASNYCARHITLHQVLSRPSTFSASILLRPSSHSAPLLPILYQLC